MNDPAEIEIAIGADRPTCAIQHELTTEYLTERHAAMSLDERGLILDCNKSFETLLGIDVSELVWQHVSNVFPQLSAEDFARAGEVYPLLDYLMRCTQRYQAKKFNGDTITSNLIFVRHEQEGKRLLRLMVFPADDAEVR